MKKYLFFIFISVILSFLTSGLCLATESNEEIIGTVNGENIYLKEFNRLYNAQKKKLEKNGPIDKVTEKTIKEKLLDLIIDEYIILEEAKERNIQIPDEVLATRLNQIKEKVGGEEGFNKFLSENNATIEDAKREIKNQLQYSIVKNQLEFKQSKDPSFNYKDFLTEKKSKSNIVIYKEKMFPKEENKDLIKEQQTEAQEAIALRNNPYPTITKSKVDEIKKLEKNTNEILRQNISIEPPAVQIKNDKSPVKKSKKLETIKQLSNKTKDKTKENFNNLKRVISTKIAGQKLALKDRLTKIKLARTEKKKKLEDIAGNQNLIPGKPIAIEQKIELNPDSQLTVLRSQHAPSSSQPSGESFNYTSNLNELNIFKRNNSSLQNIQLPSDLHKEASELRKRIEERRITVK